MEAQISTAARAAIMAAAAASPGREVCGLLFGTRDRIVWAQLTANVAANPACAFELDPAALLAAHRAARAGGPRPVGCFHSHPGGTATPSPRDAAAAAPDGWLWLIVGAGALTAWRAVPDGAWLDRFDPVALTACADSG